MPSPLGHALGGLAAGWAVAGPSAVDREPARRQVWRTGALFAALGMLPDIDLLFGAHSGPTHGLGAALIAGLVVLACRRQPRLALGAAAAYASHTLLDWLGTDSSPPIGIKALWPFAHAYYESHLHLFGAISRRYWLPGFVEQNVRAVAWEVLVLLPVVLVVHFGRQLLVTRQKEKGRNGRTRASF